MTVVLLNPYSIKFLFDLLIDQKTLKKQSFINKVSMKEVQIHAHLYEVFVFIAVPLLYQEGSFREQHHTWYTLG